jgi:hypothetical protein
MMTTTMENTIRNTIRHASTRRTGLCLLLLVLLAVVAGRLMPLAGKSQENTVFAASKTPADVTGTWSGLFQSNHSDGPSFNMTVVINHNSTGELVGDSSLDASCVDGTILHVTVTGSNVVLAGSDNNGANITFRGSVDNTGTLLNLSYTLNGSASGKCEQDDGSGTLGKR